MTAIFKIGSVKYFSLLSAKRSTSKETSERLVQYHTHICIKTDKSLESTIKELLKL